MPNAPKLIGPKPPPRDVPLHPTPWRTPPSDADSAPSHVEIWDANNIQIARCSTYALANLIVDLVNREGAKVYRGGAK